MIILVMLGLVASAGVVPVELERLALVATVVAGISFQNYADGGLLTRKTVAPWLNPLVAALPKGTRFMHSLPCATLAVLSTSWMDGSELAPYFWGPVFLGYAVCTCVSVVRADISSLTQIHQKRRNIGSPICHLAPICHAVIGCTHALLVRDPRQRIIIGAVGQAIVLCRGAIMHMRLRHLDTCCSIFPRCVGRIVLPFIVGAAVVASALPPLTVPAVETTNRYSYIQFHLAWRTIGNLRGNVKLADANISAV